MGGWRSAERHAGQVFTGVGSTNTVSARRAMTIVSNTTMKKHSTAMNAAKWTVLEWWTVHGNGLSRRAHDGQDGGRPDVAASSSPPPGRPGWWYHGDRTWLF